MSLVKLPKMTHEEIAKIIREQKICRIAFRGERSPYIAPFQYTSIEGQLYFHFTDYGRKAELLKQDELVCVEIERTTPDMESYAFVALIGRLKIVAEPEERTEAIKKMADEGEARFSTNFLAAHGLPRECGWSRLSHAKSLVIVKLEEVLECVGLKSPG